tara:strand:+ start:9053 stop:10024 length:972 start_codon:yes stop_codon:yes gene_type:complete
MSKILVKASPQIQIGPDGKPQMFYNVGFGGRRGGGDGARGRTMRSRALGAAGTLAGLAGGLAGESRSLGGFLSNLQVGAMQGGALGRRIADSRLVTPRRRQARADLVEGQKQAQAKDDAQARLAGEREMKRRRGLDRRDLSLEQIRDMGPSPNRRRILPGIGGKNMTQFGYDLAAFQSEQEAAAAEQARQEKLRARGRRRDDDPSVEAVRNIDPERLRAAQQVLANVGIEAPQQQAQAPQQIAPLSQETQNQITQGDQMPNPDDAFVDHDNDGGSAGQIAEGEMPESEVEEQQEQRVPSRLRRRFETDEEEQRGFDTFMGGGQ